MVQKNQLIEWVCEFCKEGFQAQGGKSGLTVEKYSMMLIYSTRFLLRRLAFEPLRLVASCCDGGATLGATIDVTMITVPNCDPAVHLNRK